MEIRGFPDRFSAFSPMIVGEMAATELHRALADPRRERLVAELECAPDGLDVQQLATRLGVHANTVRWHLGVLADAGVVESRAEARATPGRPRILYVVRPGADEPARDEYRLLATALTSTLAGLDDGAERAYASGRAWGRYLVPRPEPGTRVDATTEVVALLGEQGFAPTVEANEICMHRCPFVELALTHPDIVCTLHRGLVDGALEELRSDLRTEELEVFPTPDVCIARLG